MSRLRVSRLLAVALLCAPLGGCDSGKAPASSKTASPSAAPPIDARRYDAFYVWPGVRPSPALTPHLLYLLDGEVRRRPGPARFTRLRPGTPHLPGTPLWLVVRVDRLDLGERNWAAIIADMQRWQDAGNTVAGLQIDFDATTQGLDRYSTFLAEARQHLPRPWKLSITGLMDWAANGDPQALAALKPVVDEVVVQTYQGRSTIPGYEAWFAKMTHFPLPFRVALAEGGAWTPPAMLAHEPQFRGYVVFLMSKRVKG